jgi:hypothetical protein
MIHKNPQKSTIDSVAEFLPKLSREQLRFIVAMQEYPSKTAAAEAIGLKPNTVYKWPKVIDDALELIQQDVANAARQMRKQMLLKAMHVKLGGLESDDELVKQRVATEIIEGELGKPTQRQEHSGPDGGAIELNGTGALPTSEQIAIRLSAALASADEATRARLLARHESLMEAAQSLAQDLQVALAADQPAEEGSDAS